MKKGMLALLLICVCSMAFAQENEETDEKEKFFKKENLFTGGNLTLSFGRQYTALGIGPYFGYSLNKYVDVAATVNVNYNSQRDNIYLDDRFRQTTIGPGAFARIYPLRFVFAQVQYEHNFIKQKYIYPSTFVDPSEIKKVDLNSVLIGAGYAGGRDKYNKSFFYFSVMWDVSRLQNSPYTDNLNRAVPIIRAGYHFALFQ